MPVFVERSARRRRTVHIEVVPGTGVRVIAPSRLSVAEIRAVIERRAAWLADTGERYTSEAAMAKLYASEAATRACNASLQIHGGYGYTREFDIERHLRDVKLCEIGEGTSQVQRIVIAKHLLK